MAEGRRLNALGSNAVAAGDRGRRLQRHVSGALLGSRRGLLALPVFLVAELASAPAPD
jgi:hypothetical protein